MIDMVEPVSLTFSLRYLTSFTKATPLAPSVVRWGGRIGRAAAAGPAGCCRGGNMEWAGHLERVRRVGCGAGACG